MKLEIKNISLGSILFSVYPLIVFAFSLASVLLGVGELAGETIMENVMQAILLTLAQTLVILVLSVVVVVVYNLFCSFGIKGIRFEIEEVGGQDEAQ